jgi:hypothetical protein
VSMCDWCDEPAKYVYRYLATNSTYQEVVTCQDHQESAIREWIVDGEGDEINAYELSTGDSKA